MQDFLQLIYFWLKAGHIIFVVFWMAGLFMLPRYFVYHQESAPDSPENALWLERERKLLKIILLPSIVVVWVLGVLLAFSIGAWSQGWFHAKLALVIALSAYHGYLAGYAGKLARGERPLTGKHLRLLNEVPGVAVALIVILAVIKPF
jgi:protoporphyrinogen IX oxidase